MEFETNTAISTRDKITVYGYDLTEELVGKINLADMIFLGVKNRKPTENESIMLNAVMVSISEHGFTPSSIATRLTYLGAPEATQAAVAAGLLGAGTVYLGAMESTAKMLQEAYSKYKEDTPDIKEIASKIFSEKTSKRLQIPGFGHPIHRPVDPRTVKLFSLAEEYGFKGAHIQLLEEVHRLLCEDKGKQITLNAAGAVGAVMSDMEIDWRVVKPIMVAARAVGLVGHITEEMKLGRKESVGQRVFDYFDEHTTYAKF
ncbi:citryl-CoA lyase [Bacillus sp. 1P02SD]|uniref:citryl-CoA lyase n=1 Tax=Bacillus sp. 1P02SD TaxID=3132264 RepID=UPI0039A05FB7